MDMWKKIREDGSLGLHAVFGGLGAVVRRGGAMPEFIRLRWRLRETSADAEAAYEALGRYIASQLTAGAATDPSDEETQRYCRRIEALRAEERRLQEELAAWTSR
ncbi:MAG: hypothetical protein HY207_08270 [Nitrospirae bacterium]|nr:hypothetical protein [Nitrospirota bacterium]